MQKESAIREPLILGDKTYHQITEDVCAPVEGKANKYWYMAFSVAVIVALWGVGCILIHHRKRNWRLGTQYYSRLGLGHYQLCLVGRYWSRGNLDFSGSFAFQTKMENGN